MPLKLEPIECSIGAFVIAYASYDDRPLGAERVPRDFVGAMLPAITRSLEYARGDQPSS
jgi:hypothetical protein